MLNVLELAALIEDQTAVRSRLTEPVNKASDSEKVKKFIDTYIYT